MTDADDADGEGLHRTVDISDADAADAVAETSAGAEDIRERGKEEATRYLQDAEGQTAAERANNAMRDLRETVQQTEQQLRAVRQQRQEKESRREKLADTKLRVENQSADHTIMQTLGGGITLEVPRSGEVPYHERDGESVPVGVDPDHDGEWDGAYDRDDLVRDIEETREQLADQLDTLADRAKTLEDALAVAEVAYNRLDDYRAMAQVQDQDHDAERGVPEHAQHGHGSER